jgi:hypothetical protein
MWHRLCENSDVELARRKFVSITLNNKRTALAVTSKEEKRENNSAHSLLVHVFTQPGHLADISVLADVRLALPAQPVDATQALNLSAGVSNCKVSRGRSLS